MSDIVSSTELNSDLLDAMHNSFHNKVLNAIRAGANVNVDIDANCGTYLHVAVRSGNEGTVRLLLAYGANPNKYAEESDHALDYDIVTPLHSAIKQGFERIVILLMEYGAAPNAYTMQGFNALHLAIKFGHLSIFRYILQTTNTDSRINSHLYPDWTALHYAVYFNKIEIIKILLDNNANIVAKNGYDITPLQLVQSKDSMDAILTHPRFLNKEKDLVHLLYIKHVNFNARYPPNYKSLFLMAYEYGYSKLIKYMKEYGAQMENNLQWDLHFLHNSFENQLQM